MRPLVSILFPCYNAEKYLHVALESILAQDYNNLQIICVNDGSTDNTAAIITDFQLADTRVEVVTIEKNRGLINCLNTAIGYVKGDFFARMDADDFCPTYRISEQVDFLERHPEFEMVSGGYHYFVETGKALEYVPPVASLPHALQFISLFSTPLTHAAVLGRKGILEKGYYYDQEFPHSEDYELFSRLALQNVPMANLDRTLYWVRLNPASVSVVHNAIQIQSHLRITERNINTCFNDNISISDNVLKLISNRIDKPVSYIELHDALRLIDHYYNRRKHDLNYSQDEIREIEHYLRLHKVNILIQSNKVAFKSRGFKNLSFFFSACALIRPSYSFVLIKKIIVYLKYRLV